MQNIQTLKELTSSLPDAVKANAVKLIEEMGAVVEGIGDEPVMSGSSPGTRHNR